MNEASTPDIAITDIAVNSSAVTNLDTFQGLIQTLQSYWAEQGCVVMQPLDMEVGAGTFHPATFLRAIGPEPWRAAYVSPIAHPLTGGFAKTPTRLNLSFRSQDF